MNDSQRKVIDWVVKNVEVHEKLNKVFDPTNWVGLGAVSVGSIIDDTEIFLGEPQFCTLGMDEFDLVPIKSKAKVCSHQWKTDFYFSAHPYTTCSVCGVKKEEI